MLLSVSVSAGKEKKNSHCYQQIDSLLSFDDYINVFSQDRYNYKGTIFKIAKDKNGHRERKMSDYNKAYSSHKAVFGEKPEKILIDFYKKIDNSSPILDIGAGQGRNTFFLAEKGYGVEALEPSEVGIKQIQEIADKNSLPIFCSHENLSTFEPKVDYYSAVLIFGLLQILTRNQINTLISSLTGYVAEESLIFITAFSTVDPIYNVHKENDKEIGKNSFEDTNGMVRTYFEPNEILELFPDYKVLHHKEFLTEKHQHGDGVEHQHAMIEVIFEV